MKKNKSAEEEAIVEAVLFTMGKSVETRQLAAALRADMDTAREAALRLKKRYDRGKHGMQITRLEDSWQMCTRAEYYENLIEVASAPKKQVLTDVALETLSIVAYKQPITKLEIEKIRGVKSDHAVNRLIIIISSMRWAAWTRRAGRLYLRPQRNFSGVSASDPQRSCLCRRRISWMSSGWRRRRS